MSKANPNTLIYGLLKRTGGIFIITVILFAQGVTSPLGIFIAAQVIATNAGLTSEQIVKLATVAGSLMFLRNIFLLVYVFMGNRVAIYQLDNWKKGLPLTTDINVQRVAWRQISSLAWRYILVALISLFAFTLSLSLAYLYFVLGGTFEQVLYTLIATLVAGLSIAILEVLLVEGLLKTARIILLPEPFEMQISGVVGIRMLYKFQIAFFVLILISVLLVAPIGYHQTTRVLYEDIGSQQVLIDLQNQSVLVGIFSLVLGMGLSYALTKNTTQSIREIITVFGKVERGDLTERLSISTTDEIGELSIYFNRMIKRLGELQTGLEIQVSERTDQLQATLEVARVASGTLDTPELMRRVINLITERFGYYYTAIFLLDETGRWAELMDATGEAGAALKSSAHRLEVGGKSMVGTTIATRQAKIALDTGQEFDRFNNPLLPETRSEIAIPLLVGDRIIGALDVQSRDGAAFRAVDIDTLHGVANLVAIALENARLFQESQKNIEDLRQVNRRYISNAWADFGGERGRYEYSTSPEQSNASNSLNVPVIIRDQVIGQLCLEGDQEWSSEERLLIEAVATQAALALENARLLEESQELALRERLAADIITKVWASSNPETILQTAIQEIGRALRADEASIEISPEKR